MLSTMQDGPLLVSGILRHGQQVYGDSRVTTIVGPDGESGGATFAEVADRAEQLAKALGRLGIGDSDRVGTFLWNNQTHLEAYLGVPAMGAVLHTFNLRLFPEQLAYVINHAEDQVIIVDASIARSWPGCATRSRRSATSSWSGEGDTVALGADPRLRRAAGRRGAGLRLARARRTPGRGHVLHVGDHRQPQGRGLQPPVDLPAHMAITAGASLGISERDRVLSIVPMFHANAWGTPYAAFMTGADLIMPQQFLQAAPLAAIIDRTGRPSPPGCRPSGAISSATPSHSGGPLEPADDHRRRRRGAPPAHRAVPRRARGRDGPGLGDDRDQPAVRPGHPAPPGAPGRGDGVAGQDRADRARCRGADLRRRRHRAPQRRRGGGGVRGPGSVDHRLLLRRSVTGPVPRRLAAHRGHRVARPRGYMQISDRSKDVIKSGGEWISSVELENEVMAHPDVVEAAVIAVPDERWSERPLVAVVLEEGSAATPDDLLAFLTDRVSRWWLPERWSIITEVPEDQRGQVRQEGAPGPPRRGRPRGHRSRDRRPLTVARSRGHRRTPGSIAEDLADAALDRLRQNADSVRPGVSPIPALTAEEKRITRARRAVEKAGIRGRFEVLGRVV